MQRNSTRPLEAKRALVTGAGQRVGAAIARALGAEGMRVAVHYHASEEGAHETVAAIDKLGGEAFVVSADLYDVEQAKALVDTSVARLGGLDLLVSSAANFDRVPYESIDENAWDRAMSLNLRAGFVLAKQATPALRAASGSIVFITCTSATEPYRNYLPYVVSKGALRQLMRVLALELAPEVRVNAVAPGTVLPPLDMEAGVVARLASRTPLGRVGSAEEVASAVVYLAGSSFVTGHEIVVDGGQSLGLKR